MDRLIRRVNSCKTNKSSINGYAKCLVFNDKAKELFKNSKNFNDVKKYITTKKVS